MIQDLRLSGTSVREAPGAEWRATHRSFPKSHGLPNAGGWTGQTDGVKGARELDCVHICASLTQLKAGASIADWVIDVSQSVTRKAWTCSFPCLTTSSVIFLYGRGRLLSAREHLRVMGFPDWCVPSSMKPPAFRSLAGEAIAVPCAAWIL